MARRIQHPLRELRFTGGRFEENTGWLDLDILPELLMYQKILLETAKEEWRRRNPDRERLPPGFEKSIVLGIHHIKAGSLVVPIERIIEVDDDAMPLYVEDEVDEAARLIDETLLAIDEDVLLPQRLPSRILPLFEDWGKTLAPDEGIVLNGQAGRTPRFDAGVRERLLSRKHECYEDAIDLVGEVRAAELRAHEGGSFTILLANGDAVSGFFTDEQEEEITEALHEHRQVRLKIKGVGEFEASGRLRKILRIDHFEERSVGEIPFDQHARPIWEVIAEIGQSVPEEDWNKVPTDIAENLHHYLYGDPREDGR